MRFSVDLSHTRAPSHADTAELRPCHPEKVAQTELAERHLCVQERCLKLLVVKHEVVRRLELLRLCVKDSSGGVNGVSGACFGHLAACCVPWGIASSLGRLRMFSRAVTIVVAIFRVGK